VPDLGSLACRTLHSLNAKIHLDASFYSLPLLSPLDHLLLSLLLGGGVGGSSGRDMFARLATLPMATILLSSAFIACCLLLSLPPLPRFFATPPASTGSSSLASQPLYNYPTTAKRVILTEEGHQLRANLSTLFPYQSTLIPKIPELIWQTWKYKPSDRKFSWDMHQAHDSWSRQHPTHKHDTLDNKEVEEMIKTLYTPTPDVYEAYTSMPLDVHRADFFRYLILFAQGGTYSDIDTDALKPVWEWMPEQGPAMEHRVGLVVGIEADPNREDWAQWYSRRVQLCQWTIRSKPGHPILADVIAKIVQETLRMKRRGHLTPSTMDRTTMEYTGPGTWTDSVFDYLSDPRYITPQDRLEAGPLKMADTVSHLDFTGLRDRKLVADVLMLPITSFSPGQGHMGSGAFDDPLAFVKHRFLGE
jgi:alpha 1,6-mannosyltransferase